MTFMEEPGAKNVIAQAHACFEIESFWICNQSCEIVGVFPFAICAAVAGRDQIIRDLIFEEVGLSAIPHRPVVPLAMEVVKIDNRRGPEFDAADFISGRASAGVVPWADYKKMFSTRLGRSIRHMIAVKSERAELISIVLTRNRQNRKRDFLKLLGRRHH